MVDVKELFENKVVGKVRTEHTREELTAIWVIKYLNELVGTGVAEGKPFTVTDLGEQVIDGFEPTEEEVKAALDHFKAAGYLIID